MSNYMRELEKSMKSSSKEKEVEYEDITIWKIAAQIEGEFPRDKFAVTFAEAYRQYFLDMEAGSPRRQKLQPLDRKTVWGIAEVLNMLPSTNPDPGMNICRIFEDAVGIYIDRVNRDDKRAYDDETDPNRPLPTLKIVKNN